MLFEEDGLNCFDCSGNTDDGTDSKDRKGGPSSTG